MRKKIPTRYRIYQKGPTQIELSIPPVFFKQENLPGSTNVKNMSLISKIIVNPEGSIEIITKEKNPKFTYFEIGEENKLVIDIMKQKKNKNKNKTLTPKKNR